ncbi:hypothetical protein [Haloactinopolyspora sp.]|uniref:hypothetical protein n=1 Tax=Haloactinopolyspora sp. TaxID=1966353 RepID=UPI00261A16D7|nr:hypothetical protein [Haloactinopolyspora sp.]
MADSMSDNDAFIMLLAVPLALPILAPLGFGAWDEGREWMIERGFIASADDATWSVPGWDGAGIGSAHVVLLVCLVVLILVIGSVISRHQRERQINTEGWGSD